MPLLPLSMMIHYAQRPAPIRIEYCQPAEVEISHPEIQQVMGSMSKRVWIKLIEDKLILAAANDKGIQVRDDLIDKRMQEIKDRYASEDDFLRAINAGE